MKFVRSTFLWLTSKTYPFGSEYKSAKRLMTSIGSKDHIEAQPYMVKKFIEDYNFKFDNNGNLYTVIPNEKGYLPNTMFCAHTDTVLSTRRFNWMSRFVIPWGKSRDVNHVFSKTKDFVKTDGNTTLGADDKAGVSIILSMIKAGKPGVYYLFRGEEVGLIGSRKLRKRFYENTDLKNITKCLSLDRKGYSSVITHQKYKRTCSDEFAVQVCRELNSFGFWFSPDQHGSSTDSRILQDRINECTNISVGYFKAHSNSECQDLEFLEDLTSAFIQINWEKIKSRRIFNLGGKNPNFGFNDFSYKRLKNMIYPPKRNIITK